MFFFFASFNFLTLFTSGDTTSSIPTASVVFGTEQVDNKDAMNKVKHNPYLFKETCQKGVKVNNVQLNVDCTAAVLPSGQIIGSKDIATDVLPSGQIIGRKDIATDVLPSGQIIGSKDIATDSIREINKASLLLIHFGLKQIRRLKHQLKFLEFSHKRTTRLTSTRCKIFVPMWNNLVMIAMFFLMICVSTDAANCDTHTTTGVAGGTTSCPTNSIVSKIQLLYFNVLFKQFFLSNIHFLVLNFSEFDPPSITIY